MKLIIVFLPALASTAFAQPHGHGHGHGHGSRHLARLDHQHNKRAMTTEWETVYTTETVIEYIDETATTWITPDAPKPSTTLATVTSPSSTSSSTSTDVPGQFFEGTSSSAPPSQASPAENPVTAPAYVAPAPTPTAPEPTSDSPVVESTPSAPKAAVETPSNSGSSTGSSGSSGYSYSGDLTYYAVGLGACGEDDSGKDKTDNIVAMSSEVMGSQSNGNPMCGKTITIYNPSTGHTATGVIRDKCPGCASGSIDVSEKLFTELGDMTAGRYKGVQWKFN